MFSLILTILISFSNMGYSAEYYYGTKSKSEGKFIHKTDGFIYHYKENTNQYQVIVETNVNLATVSFITIQNNITNDFSLFNNRMLRQGSEKKIIPLHNREIILFPETQLTSFIKNSYFSEIEFVTILLNNLLVFSAHAQKILAQPTNINGKIYEIVDITPIDTNKELKNKMWRLYFNDKQIVVKKEEYNSKNNKLINSWDRSLKKVTL